MVPSHSRRRVLTTELVTDAQSFNQFAESAPQELKNQAGETIFRVCFDSIFRHCVYNADPHPGNYLMHDSGTVTFLDYGCVRRFDVDFIDAWKRLALAITNHDRAGFERYFPDLGLVAKPKRFDWDYQWEAMCHLYRPFTQHEPRFTYSQEYVRESYGLLMFDNPNQRLMAMPPAWLLLNRLQWGLNSVLALLDAQGAWPDYFRAAIESPTRLPEPVAEAAPLSQQSPR